MQIQSTMRASAFLRVCALIPHPHIDVLLLCLKLGYLRGLFRERKLSVSDHHDARCPLVYFVGIVIAIFRGWEGFIFGQVTSPFLQGDETDNVNSQHGCQ